MGDLADLVDGRLNGGAEVESAVPLGDGSSTDKDRKGPKTGYNEKEDIHSFYDFETKSLVNLGLTLAV